MSSAPEIQKRVCTPPGRLLNETGQPCCLYPHLTIYKQNRALPCLTPPPATLTVFLNINRDDTHFLTGIFFQFFKVDVWGIIILERIAALGIGHYYFFMYINRKRLIPYNRTIFMLFNRGRTYYDSICPCTNQFTQEPVCRHIDVNTFTS